MPVHAIAFLGIVLVWAIASHGIHRCPPLWQRRWVRWGWHALLLASVGSFVWGIRAMDWLPPVFRIIWGAAFVVGGLSYRFPRHGPGPHLRLPLTAQALMVGLVIGAALASGDWKLAGLPGPLFWTAQLLLVLYHDVLAWAFAAATRWLDQVVTRLRHA